MQSNKTPKKKNKSILILNGVNLDLLGMREPEVYGSKTLKDLEHELFAALKYFDWDKIFELRFIQSNDESVFLNELTAVDHGVIMNPGAWSHTSIAIRDRCAALKKPIIEVHLSNIYNREDWRKNLTIAPKCAGVISGFNFESYTAALWILGRRLLDS